MSAHEVAEHIEHAAHGGGHGANPRLNTYIGATMAGLGVLLALPAARVGAERTELVEAMVEQQNAHAKYQAQDIKHRMAMLTLQSARVSIAGSANEAAGMRGLASVADTAERYLKESETAKEWVEAYDPLIKCHVEGQEQFENAQLLAEIGIVIASIALLMHRKAAWYAALVLAVLAAGLLGTTWLHARSTAHAAEAKLEETGKAYRAMRTSNKSTAKEEELITEVRRAAGAAPAAPKPAE